ncbi:hypothetical protein jhhlp_000624 [Lomentospora prolificans]|uniref:NmrA-like domain-containing protein n=1 Tax=Lomentospora prolificans TaxID=41688 RepID=A0A2N3NJ22_9PEZI|nr:hypothetical protein jhhlp_000624 [Lomentospora prolificans]
MTSITTIIFGPTGGVGAAVVSTVHERGAKVVLALRDPQKPIRGFSAEQERAAGFERVQADLTQPETITAAVQKTGAKRAFLYVAFGQTTDNMKATITALKDAGIEFVVLLSSASVQRDKRSYGPTEFVPFAHAQVEVNLEDAFGSTGYVAVRPTFFASNAFWWKDGIKQGDAKIAFSEALADWITPEDIGRVCGSLLIDGPQAPVENSAVNIIGPNLISLREGIEIIGREIGKDVKVTDVGEPEGIEYFVKQLGFPPPLAAALVNEFKDRVEKGHSNPLFSSTGYQEAMANISKFGGKPPMSLVEWVKEHKDDFGA